MADPRSLSSLHRILAKNTASNALFLVLNQTVSLCAYLVLIRLLPLQEYGVLMLIGAILGQFMILDFGLSTGLEKFIPEYRANENTEDISRGVALATLFLFLVGLVCALFFCLLLVTDAASYLGVPEAFDLSKPLLVAIVIAILYWPLQSLQSACRGLNLHHSLNKIQLAFQVSGLMVTILVAYLQYPLYVILIAFLSPGVFAPLAQWRLLSRKLGQVPFKLDSRSFSLFREMVAFSGWVFLIRLSSQVTNRLDRIVVSMLLGVAALPIYYGAMRVLKAAIQFNSVLKSAVLPIASEVRKTHRTRQFSTLGYRGLRVFNTFLSLISFFVVLFSYPVLFALGGEPLAEHSLLVQLGVILTMPVAGRAFFGEMLIGSGEVIGRQALWSVATALVFGLVLLVGATYWSVSGAILAHPVTHVSMMLLWLPLIAGKTDLGVARVLKAIVGGQWPVWVGLGLSVPVWYEGSWDESQLLYSAAIYLVVLVCSWFFSLDGGVRDEITRRVLGSLRRDKMCSTSRF